MHEEQRQRPHLRRRVISREEWEIPPQSDRWFNLALMIFGIAAAAASTAVTLSDPVIQAILCTLAVCLAAAGVAFLFVDRELNRGRRPKRSRVVEETVE